MHSAGCVFVAYAMNSLWPAFSTDQPPLTDTSRLELAILYVLIRPWTTVEPSGLVWPVCRETETAHLSHPSTAS